MKKKWGNGFTIVELMGVITILGIIFLIAVPAVTRFLGKSKDQYYQTTMDNIESAVNEYLIDYPDEIPKETKGYTEIPLSLLVKLNYIDTIKNPETKDTCTDDSYIYVSNEGYKEQSNNETTTIQGANFKLSYDICLKCGLYKGKETMGTCKNKERVLGFVNGDGIEIQTLNLYKGTNYTLNLKDLVANKAISYSYINYTSTNENIAKISYGELRTITSGTVIIKANTTKTSSGKYTNAYSTSYPSYTTYLIVNVTDKPIKITDMTAWTSSTMTTKVEKITNGVTIYIHTKPDNANKSISCSIVDENDNVVTRYGQANLLHAGTNGNPSALNACKYIRFQGNLPTAIIDPETNEITTHTYLLIKPTQATEDSAFLKIPIYTSD